MEQSQAPAPSQSRLKPLKTILEVNPPKETGVYSSRHSAMPRLTQAHSNLSSGGIRLQDPYQLRTICDQVVN